MQALLDSVGRKVGAVLEARSTASAEKASRVKGPSAAVTPVRLLGALDGLPASGSAESVLSVASLPPASSAWQKTPLSSTAPPTLESQSSDRVILNPLHPMSNSSRRLTSGLARPSYMQTLSHLGNSLFGAGNARKDY